MSDPILIIVAIVAAVGVAGALRRLASGLVRTMTSLAGLVVIAWVVLTYAGIDVPALLAGINWPSMSALSGLRDTVRAFVADMLA